VSLASPAHDAGGKTLIPVPIWMRSTAVFGGVNEEYRYTLSRTWDESLPAKGDELGVRTAGPVTDRYWSRRWRLVLLDEGYSQKATVIGVAEERYDVGTRWFSSTTGATPPTYRLVTTTSGS
jgi:hypothetical protein